MDKTLLKKAAFQSIALMLAVITLSYAKYKYQTVTIAASNTIDFPVVSAHNESAQEAQEQSNSNSTTTDGTVIKNETDDESSQAIELSKLRENMDQNIQGQLGEEFIIITKPKGANISYQIEDLYITHSLRFILNGLNQDDNSKLEITRVKGDKLFSKEPIFTEEKYQEKNSKGEIKEVVTKNYGDDPVHGITVSSKKEKETGLYQAEILIELDSVYVQTVYEDKDYYFIDLKKPHEVYDKVLVIDAGHGGKDAGALSRDEKSFEKNINLEILLELKELLDKENIKVYYTRTTDDTIFLRPRVTLANNVDCDFFISIHCNASDLNSPNGTEALYYNTEFKGVKSFDLARIMVEEIGKQIPLRQRGLVEERNDDIFILEKAVVPATLIEVGYITNNNDMNFLRQKEKRKAAARGIYNGIMRAYNELIIK